MVAKATMQKTIFLVTAKIGYVCLITHIFIIWYLFDVSYISLESICISLYDDTIFVGNICPRAS